MKKCPVCGREYEFPYEENFISKHGECFSCYSWEQRLPLKDDPHSVIIDGVHYVIGPEDDTSKFRGFGGDKFVIRFKDGREVTTTNLWCRGNVPEYWRPQFPDNAEFDWQWKKLPSGTEYLISK